MLMAVTQFCNGIQLNRVLPPGPRDYWNQLAAEHKQAPDHQKWMYDADPFAARKAVTERQEQAARRKEEPSDGKGKTSTSTEFVSAPEAKMASSLRDLVEESISRILSENDNASYLLNLHNAQRDNMVDMGTSPTTRSVKIK